MVNDVIFESGRRMLDKLPTDNVAVHGLDKAIVDFSGDMAENDKALKGFLFPNMYRHDRVARMSDQAHKVVHDLFQLLHGEPHKLPAGWQGNMDGPGGFKTARRVADYIAGMTDRFAINLFNSLK